MTIRDYKKILPHALLAAGALFILVGLFALVRSEEAKTRDAIVMQEVIGIKQDLQMYYLSHAAYSASITIPERYEYIPSGEDGAPCAPSAACSRYEIRFFLETNLFAKKGAHTLTPEGMQ